MDAADIGSSRPHHRAVHALGPAGTKLQHRPALGSPHQAAGLGGNQALVVDAQQGVSLNELGLRRRRPDRNQRFIGEYRRSLGHRPDVPGKAEGPQIVQEILFKKALCPQVGNILFVKMQILDILDQLLQAGSNGIAAAIGNPAEKDVKIGNALLHPLTEIAVGHGHLVEVEQHRQIQLLFALHCSILCFIIMAGAGKACPNSFIVYLFPIFCNDRIDNSFPFP